MTGDVVLVVADHDDGRPRGTTDELVTLARSLGPVQVAWFGPLSDGATEHLGSYGAGLVHRIPVAEEIDLPRTRAAALAELCQEAGVGTVLLASSFAGKEIAAHLAMAIDAGLVVDATGAETAPEGTVWTQRAFAATWVLRSQVTRPRSVVAVSANSVPAERAAEPVTPTVRTRPPARPVDEVRVVERRPRPATDRPPLGEAQVVVVGGRGTGGDFGPIEDLADALGAAVGATRDATDEGWIDHAAMIGQTGTTVAPRLYVGAGVSGAVHHRGGMMAAQHVVVVNADPDAEIFDVADIGVVGDLFAVLPQAAAEIRRLRAEG